MNLEISFASRTPLNEVHKLPFPNPLQAFMNLIWKNNEHKRILPQTFWQKKKNLTIKPYLKLKSNANQ